MPNGKREKLSTEQVKKLEVISIVGLIIFAVLSYVLSSFVFKREKRNIAVFLAGEKITKIEGHKIDIDRNDVFVIGDKKSDYNVIEIKDKKVRCIEANCPDCICVEHGDLREDIDNDMIVCAPHRLVIMYE